MAQEEEKENDRGEAPPGDEALLDIMRELKRKDKRKRKVMIAHLCRECPLCGRDIIPGDAIIKMKYWVHSNCVPETDSEEMRLMVDRERRDMEICECGHTHKGANEDQCTADECDCIQYRKRKE
jgi:hypothetical protein